MTLKRWKLTLEYDGTDYCGSQIQPPHLPTIQGGGTILRLQTLQPAGKKAMDFASALNGGYVEIKL